MAKPQARKTASARRRPPQSSRSQKTAWLLAAVIIIALAIFAIVYFASHKAHKPSLAKATQPAVKPRVASKPKVAHTEPKAQQFDFYTMLPKMQMDAEDNHYKGVSVSQAKASVVKHSYSLQVGAFKHLADADRVRAKLILQGFNVQIKPVDIKGITWQRIILGPYKSLSEAKQAQDKLTKQGMKSLLFELS